MNYKHLSLDSLKNLEIIDPTLAVQMMNIFLTEFPEQIKLINSLIQTKNAYEFGRRIHALKGSLSVFGSTELCASLKKIELLAKDNKFDESLNLYWAAKKQIDEFNSEIHQFVAYQKNQAAA
jgi:HPt (histidine-containing phosphotransfer) domain-containing protein